MPNRTPRIGEVVYFPVFKTFLAASLVLSVLVFFSVTSPIGWMKDIFFPAVAGMLRLWPSEPKLDTKETFRDHCATMRL